MGERLVRMFCALAVSVALTVILPVVAFADGNDCITFSSDSAFSLSVKATAGWDGAMQYSTDHSTWSTWDGSSVSAVKRGGVFQLCVRGSGNTVVGGESDNSWRLTANSGVDCSGDIMTLLDYANPGEAKMGSGCFECLFSGNKKLVTAPRLPSRNLSANCYAQMFSYCSSLVTCPELPATTLADGCYVGMFMACDSLVNLPYLPAKTLTRYCYSQMFQACDSIVDIAPMAAVNMQDHSCASMYKNDDAIVEVPALTATNLYQYCYQSMFQQCKGLKSAASVSAVTMATGSCEAMFQGCTSMVSAPALPATTLAIFCYNSMFEDCISLTSAPKLPAKTMAVMCYNRMFYNCRSLTTAPSLPATTLASACYQEMFHLCVALTAAPALPVTTLKEGCYRLMFANCESLTEIPPLPATTLPKNCYDQMFKNCRSLSLYYNGTGKTWRIPADASGEDNWGNEMFYGIASGSTIPAKPVIGTTYFYGPAYADCDRWIADFAPGVYALCIDAAGPNVRSAELRVPAVKKYGDLGSGTRLIYAPDKGYWYLLVNATTAPDADDFNVSTALVQNTVEVRRALIAPRPGHESYGVAGDTNGNGVLNIVDAQVAYDMAKGNTFSVNSEVPMRNWLVADVDGDSCVDASDARAIQCAMLRGWS